MVTAATMDRVTEIEHALEKALARTQASSEHGCSALANVLLAALVKQRKDPRYTAQISHEMRRLAAKLVDLSGAGNDSLADRIVADAKVH